jgi:hypothetical protein
MTKRDFVDDTFELDNFGHEYWELFDLLEKTKDPMLLLQYLNVPKTLLPHFEDFFRRHKFRVKRGQYKRTDNKLLQLSGAVSAVKGRDAGVSRADAIDKAVRDYGIKDRSVLEKALRGKHSSFRKAKIVSV